MIKILISTEADRLAVAAALIKNGYTVRQGREKKTGGKAGYDNYLYLLEGPAIIGKANSEA